MDDSLSFESFLAGAKKAAHRAMDDHGRGEYDEFALHAGVAIESLAKAVLISKNPIYIAEMKGSAEMLFHLGGHRTARAQPRPLRGSGCSTSSLSTVSLTC
ncbi:hypothetical protein GCM10018785_75570 [Streptomyces longispororuber]|uniref:Uncharacterized protein n=1 Tax=Streptomyces longispororuber TaxID=68230 RepID=A0A919E1M9_9ACTN|nr:hypothetical protein [Streptomyces longispororuber]GHF02789.1 hypothetical protein GCM10018785_75570 [Streptomyces longispororuber]